MAETLITIETDEGLSALYDCLKDKQYVAYDCETTGVLKESEIIGFSVSAEVDVGYYVVTTYWDVTLQKLVRTAITQDAIINFIKYLTTKSLIMHNGVFDCMMALNNYKIDLMPSLHTDTWILAQLLDENRSNGLKELGISIFGEESTKEQKEMKESVHKNGGVLTKDTYELYKADKDLLARYGAKDTILTIKLFYHLVPILFEEGLDSFFYDDESMPLLRGPTYDMNFSGLKVDQDRLKSLRGTLEAECLEARAFIDKEVSGYVKDKYKGTTKATTFNIGATQQLSWLLFVKLGREFHTLTKGGKELCKSLNIKIPYSPGAKREFLYILEQNKDRVYEEAKLDPKTKKMKRPKKVGAPWKYLSCGKVTLGKYSKKYKWVEKLLEYAKNLKLLNTYVVGIQDRMKYGIIRPNFLQAGTTSGRYSCIAEGQLVSMPGGDKKIEDVRPGDYVYCYTREGAPTLSKVLNSFDNGMQDCIELTWSSKGTLVCTPEHKIKTKNLGWVPAGKLRICESVYGSEYLMEKRGTLIKKQHLGFRHVYDLEVENYHNFIVSEVCVHNCKNPNFQNLPREDKRVKSCIISRQGKVFVGADYSQLEPRVFASFSQDKRLMECFKSGDDFYSVIGAEVFDKPGCSLKKNDKNSFAKLFPELRDASKVIALSATYGTTANKMGPALGKTTEEAQDIIDDYFTKFSKVEQLMLDSHELVMKEGRVLNLFGRPRRIPKALSIKQIYGKTPHSELPFEVRTLLNLAVNHRIQSTAASIMNRAAIAVHGGIKELAGTNALWEQVKIVLQVHDQLILEGPESLGEEMVQLLKYCMENTVILPGVELVADPTISRDLAGQK